MEHQLYCIECSARNRKTQTVVKDHRRCLVCDSLCRVRCTHCDALVPESKAANHYCYKFKKPDEDIFEQEHEYASRDKSFVGLKSEHDSRLLDTFVALLKKSTPQNDVVEAKKREEIDMSFIGTVRHLAQQLSKVAISKPSNCLNSRFVQQELLENEDSCLLKPIN
jgi:hypothetical protein